MKQMNRWVGGCLGSFEVPSKGGKYNCIFHFYSYYQGVIRSQEQRYKKEQRKKKACWIWLDSRKQDLRKLKDVDNKDYY